METEAFCPVLVGPTGVGKSEIAFELAKKLNLEILSADAFQVFKGLEVGTVQPHLDWQKQVHHHLVGIRNPMKSWNAGEFSREAFAIVEDKRKQGIVILVVGGSGFYLRSFIEGLPPATSIDPEFRHQIQEKVDFLGLANAHQWLKTMNPSSAEKIHVNDRYRVCRALEKALSPTPLSDTSFPPRLNVVLLGIECHRDQLDITLKKRCIEIWANGLLKEAKMLKESGVPLEFPVWKAIGYFEALDYLENRISESEALEKMYRRTRQYAKRQWTWFRHQHRIKWFQRDMREKPDAITDLLAFEIVSSRSPH